MILRIQPEPKQHEAYEALRTPGVDTVFLGGGAGGGKSWWICESRLLNAIRFPGYKSYIGREELKRLMQSTFLTWVKVCNHHKIPKDLWKLNGQYNYIEFTNGSRIDLLDLKYLPTDPFYERFGSLEYTDGAIEEAGEVHFLAYDVLKSRVGRHMNKELGIPATTAITGNPKKNWTYTYFYKPFKEGKLEKGTVFIQSLYKDNSYTAEVYGEQLGKIKDKATRERLKEGNWEYDDDPTAMIQYENIIDLFTNTIDTDKEKYLICDIARYGSDKSVFTCWEGMCCYKIIVKEKMGIDTQESEIRDIAAKERIPFSNILVDEDGIGGGLVDNLRVKGFVANSTPLERIDGVKENYGSLKAQCAYILAEKVNSHQIRVECEDEAVKNLLITDLEQIKTKDADKDGKLKIISKEEIKENIGRSPDVGDTFIMRMYFDLQYPNSRPSVGVIGSRNTSWA